MHEKNLPPGMAENIPWVLHSDWMTTIKYLSHSNSLITTSMDGCLLMLDFEKRHLKWSGKEHAHGIYSCDYCRFVVSLLPLGITSKLHSFIFKRLMFKCLELINKIYKN